MKIRTKYQGEKDPFIGDRILWLRSLPVGANVTKATVTLTPKASSASHPNQFLETFSFSENPLAENELSAKKWGITKTEPGEFIEVDFHNRTTLAAVLGTGGGTTLQIDLGGTYVSVASDGTIAPNKEEFPVSLAPDDPTSLPGLVVNKFKLTSAGGNLDITKVSIRSLPSNVSVRLGQLPPFWTHLGELATDDTSPDFAAVLNTFLATAQVQEGFYVIPVVVHSDAIARLDVELIIDFIIEQRILPPHLSEIKLAYNFSTLPSVDDALTTVTLPRGAVPIAGRSTAQIIGEFQPSRIAYGLIGDDLINTPSQNPDIDVTVSPECLLAQPLKPGKEIAVTAIDLPVGKTNPGLAGLNLAIQSDADGKPSGEVLTKAEVIVGKPLPNQTNWGSATLPEPFRVEDEPNQPDKRYWLVLQSQVGAADWSAVCDTSKNLSGEPALQCSRDGGFSWRVATVEKAPAPLKALFRLRTVPENFSVPVQLQVGKGPQAKRHLLKDFAPLGRIEFSFDFAQTLSDYLEQPTVASPCGSGNLLVNGDFTAPPPDDATRKLFGFDRDRAVASYSNGHITQAILTGTVDLSRGVNLSSQRFIMLGLDDQKPPKSPIRIDCAGKDPTRTQLDEIIKVINTATQPNVAFEVWEQEQSTGKLGVRSINQSTNTRSVELFTWCNTQLPQGWNGTLGQVVRVRVPEQGQLGRVVVVLAHPTLLKNGIFIDGEQISLSCFPVVPESRASTTGAATLSQRFAVIADCTYLFQVNFQITHERDELLPLPRWEIDWLNATGAILRTDSEVLEFETRIAAEETTPWLYETLFNPPVGAVKAELRFLHFSAKSYPLILEKVTFTPTTATLRNSQFGQWQGTANARLPVGWTSLSGWVDEERDSETGQVIGVKLRGDAPEDTILVQTVEVTAGKRYELQVHSYPLFLPTGEPEAQQPQQRARIELHWQGSGILAKPVIIPLDGRDFPNYTWVGNVPDGATAAEIRLIQPKAQGELLVKSVSLSQADVVSVPLIFLSEAPGELTVSELRVAYDLPEPPAPPKPSALPRASRSSTLRRQALTLPPQQPVIEPPVEPIAEVPSTPPVPQPVTPSPSAPPAPPDSSPEPLSPLPQPPGVEPSVEPLAEVPSTPLPQPVTPPSAPLTSPPEPLSRLPQPPVDEPLVESVAEVPSTPLPQPVTPPPSAPPASPESPPERLNRLPQPPVDEPPVEPVAEVLSTPLPQPVTPPPSAPPAPLAPPETPPGKALKRLPQPPVDEPPVNSMTVVPPTLRGINPPIASTRKITVPSPTRSRMSQEPMVPRSPLNHPDSPERLTSTTLQQRDRVRRQVSARTSTGMCRKVWRFLSSLVKKFYSVVMAGNRQSARKNRRSLN